VRDLVMLDRDGRVMIASASGLWRQINNRASSYITLRTGTGSLILIRIYFHFCHDSPVNVSMTQWSRIIALPQAVRVTATGNER
jgi:hypothetical protein